MTNEPRRIVYERVSAQATSAAGSESVVAHRRTDTDFAQDDDLYFTPLVVLQALGALGALTA